MAKKRDLQNKTAAQRPRRYSSYSPGRNPANIPQKDEQAVTPETAHRKRRLAGRIITIGALFLIIIMLVIGIWDARNLSAATAKLFGSDNVFSLMGSDAPRTDASGRINILLVGYSVDDPGHPAANLTDSIILLSMDRSTDSGYMLSIPRDLYVHIPGFGYAKINEAYKDGGMPLLENIISRDFQTQISYYALIDYAAVKDTVDALGGITVNIDSQDPRGLFDPNINKNDGGPLDLRNGPQKLDGQTALNLTRARGDPCGCGQVSYGFAQSDFDRTQNQRQVLTAIKDNLNWKVVLYPWRNQQILDAISGNVKTDIPAGAVRSVFGVFISIPSSKLKSVGLRDLDGRNYLSSYITKYGQEALVPSAGLDDYSQIDDAISQLTR